MGNKKLSINVPPAAGFFSPETIKKAEEAEKNTSSAITSPPQPTKAKNKGGRPKSEVKKKQYTLTMDPALYDALKKKAKEKNKSFSSLVNDVMIDYLNKNSNHSKVQKKAIE
jgi:hypothetical protein